MFPIFDIEGLINDYYNVKQGSSIECQYCVICIPSPSVAFPGNAYFQSFSWDGFVLWETAGLITLTTHCGCGHCL